MQIQVKISIEFHALYSDTAFSQCINLKLAISVFPDCTAGECTPHS